MADLDGLAPAADSRREAFEKIWAVPKGFGGWFAAVNNQAFGARFMAASFVFFMLAGILSLLMRVQLAVPENDFVGPDVYNQLFTMHGSTMMYLVVLPFLEGLALYLLPSILGTREMAFPRVSAFSFWIFFSGGIVFFTGYLFNAVPNSGWFVYPPLSSATYSGLGLDFLLVGLGFIEIAGLATGIEIFVTILKFRAPGMTLGRMPLFAWAWLVTSAMIVLAFATLLGATVLLELDRAMGTRFFDPTGGGTPLLWQHLFWFFGHPDVYIMFLPATGMASMVIPTFAKRRIAGYPFVTIAIILTGFLSFGLWVHHMFTTGLPLLASGFFIAASLMIAIASGVQVFAWIATLWRTRPSLKTPMLYALGFLFLFVFGGITGVMVAVLPFDLQAHDTYFVVAHFHYVLIGGVVFPVLAGFHYWLPLIIGRMPSEKLGQWSFWLIFIGFNVTFFPMHISGLKGMARRVYTYSESLGIGSLNMISTIGSFVLGIGFVLVAVNFWISRKQGERAPKNPWNAGTLEWTQTSDMKNYVYLSPPIVTSRNPLWDEPPSPSEIDPDLVRVSTALKAEPSEWRAVLVTDVVTGRPQAIQRVAGPTYIPIITAIGMLVTSIATLASWYLLALASLLYSLIAVMHWLWPSDKGLKVMRESRLEELTGLTTEPTGTQATGWWAMVSVLVILFMNFGVLLYSYFYLRLYSPTWPQGDIAKPELLLPSGVYGLLLFSLVPHQYALARFRKKAANASSLALGACAALAMAFLGLQTWLLANEPFAPSTNAYASIFHVTSWFLALLILGGIVLHGAAIRSIGSAEEAIHRGYVTLLVQISSMYWRFSVVTALFTYLVLYLSPHLI